MARRTFGQRIVGGAPATKGQFPYIVDVRRGGHYCGGAIVNSDWILTAAHCSGGQPSAYSIVAGDHNIQNTDGDEKTSAVTQIIIHPGYNSQTINNDAALMKLASPFDLNASQYIKAAVLADNTDSDFETPEAQSVVAGWGATSEGGGSPSVLQWVTVPVVTTATCNARYNPSGYQITPAMICAGESGKDSCQGDSGGPMMCTRANGEVVHFGIVSWGIGCARPNYPGVYARTSAFHDFIQQHTM
jgi:trypsin